MSSLRNAVSRRPHKERAQPASRSKWGLLEKHKDYSLRAADYNQKKKKLALLEEKVQAKNDDEFAFGMLKERKGRKGQGEAGEASSLSHEAVKLLKTQDAGYLRVVAARGRREMGRVEEQVGLDAGARGSRVVFGENGETVPVSVQMRGKNRDSEGEVVEVNGDREIDDADAVIEPEGDENAALRKPKSKKVLLAERDALTRLRAERKRRKRLQDTRVAKLEALKKRQKEILAAADQLDLQRAKMARTIGGVNKNGVKFKIRERKK